MNNFIEQTLRQLSLKFICDSSFEVFCIFTYTQITILRISLTYNLFKLVSKGIVIISGTDRLKNLFHSLKKGGRPGSERKPFFPIGQQDFDSTSVKDRRKLENTHWRPLTWVGGSFTATTLSSIKGIVRKLVKVTTLPLFTSIGCAKKKQYNENCSKIKI